MSIKKDLKTSDIESLGAKFHGFINYDKKNDYFVNSDTINHRIENFIGHFLHGLKLIIRINQIANFQLILSYLSIKISILAG